MGKRLLLTAILAGALAAAADATIVVQHGLARVTIGMSKKKVRSILGAPKKAIVGQNGFGSFTEYRYGRLFVDFQGGGPVSSVSTSRRGERTKSGIGVGSKRSEVLQKIRGASCGSGLCSVGKQVPGKIVTTFYLRQGKVVLVAVARVLD